ncbi:MAG: hypothetical protein GKR91_15210 [Pseudomonadales bacterium]|nr:hypothetical protein [Pseudomonadales bacterium]
MAKSLFYRLFGLRKVPIETRNRLAQEGILFDEEGTSCALAFKGFKGERKSSLRGWQSAEAGSLIITNQTFYVALPFTILCDKLISEGVKHFSMELKDSNKLVMKFDAEKLFANSSGELSCHWRMQNAEVIYRHLNSLKE